MNVYIYIHEINPIFQPAYNVLILFKIKIY